MTRNGLAPCDSVTASITNLLGPRGKYLRWHDSVGDDFLMAETRTAAVPTASCRVQFATRQ